MGFRRLRSKRLIYTVERDHLIASAALASAMSKVTKILQNIDEGDRYASEQLLPIVYDELRRLARAKMSSERTGHTLQTTGLVHEAYLRLVDQKRAQRWNSTGHFFSAAAEAMRRILVEHARKRGAQKYGGDHVRVPLTDQPDELPDDPATILQIDDCLDRIAEKDPQVAELIKLRCFAGFSVVEAAESLGISKTTAYGHWNYAKALLGSMLR